MVTKKQWNNFFKELEETGNVYRSCKKVGIVPSTYYRTYKDDFEFRDRANDAIEMGKRNPPEMAEIGLFQKVREGEWNAIKFMLTHRHQDYRPKPLPPRPKFEEEVDQITTAEEERNLLVQQLHEAGDKIVELSRELKMEGKLTEAEAVRIKDDIPIPGVVFVDFSGSEDGSTELPDTS